MTLETLLKQVEELDALKKSWTMTKDLGVGAHRLLTQAQLADAAPILVEVIRKLTEQRNGLIETLDMVAGHGISNAQSEILNTNLDLDAIVAKRLEGEE